MANIYKEKGQCKRAIQLYARACWIDPGYADAHWNLALTYLLNGEFQKGWDQYHWRYRALPAGSLYPHHYQKPKWDGTALQGKRLLIHCEQGLGDTIQFARYLPILKSMGATLLFETWQPLLRLMGSVKGVDQLLETGAQKTPEGQFDLWASIMDLPELLRTDLDTMPLEVPYLTPDPEGVQQWGQRIEGAGYKVGIVWAGAPTHGNDHNRSCHLRSFRELAQLDTIQLYSLQRGPAMEQIRELDSDFKMTPIGHLFKDLMDTACAMEHLDLIISVDTAVAHLAGALGKPVWTLLPHAPDWRWMLNRSDSPWYPSMRLFRQPRPAAWQALFSELLKHLKQTLGHASVSVPRKVAP